MILQVNWCNEHNIPDDPCEATPLVMVYPSKDPEYPGLRRCHEEMLSNVERNIELVMGEE